MSLLALLDADIFCFRCAASCEHVVVDMEHPDDKSLRGKEVLPVEIAYARVNTMLEDTLRELGTDKYQLFLTCHEANFRRSVSKEYKANRTTPKPLHLPALEEFVIKEWGAVIAVGQEADDALGIAQMVHWEDEKEQSVIVSIDKDLLQIPGSHYNFVKSEFTEVSEEEGMFSFYIQLLMGDSTDNVSGCPGIGPKKAEKALRPFIGDEEGMYRAVVDKYTEAYPQLAEEEIEDIIITTGRLVWIRRKEGELWLPPIIQ